MPLRVPTVCVAVGLQQIVEELHIELVVLHNQDSLGHPRSFACPPPMPASGTRTGLSMHSAAAPFKLVPICYGKANGTQ